MYCLLLREECNDIFLIKGRKRKNINTLEICMIFQYVVGTLETKTWFGIIAFQN